MKITLPNGITLDGNELEVSTAAEKLGYGHLVPKHDPKFWHYSESKNRWVKISEMDLPWLRNSVVKFMRDWLEDVTNAENPRKFVELIINHDEPHLAALLKEVSKYGRW